MPEQDRLAKMILHRMKQEKKNDRERLHKNKIEIDRLAVQTHFIDSNKNQLEHTFTTKRLAYVNKLEKIYARQLQIDDERRKEEERKKNQPKDNNRRKLSRVSSGSSRTGNWSPGRNMSDFEQESSVNTSHGKLRGSKHQLKLNFVNKAKSLSGGYRDNDPPLVYYKHKGIVPPERLVHPLVSADIQANHGGGFQSPASAQHILEERAARISSSAKEPHRLKSIAGFSTTDDDDSDVSSVITYETDENDDVIMPAATVTDVSATRQNGDGASEVVQQAMTTSNNDDDDVIQQVTIVQARRSVPTRGLITVGDEEMTKETPRPSTAVHFKQKKSAASRRSARSTISSTVPEALMGRMTPAHQQRPHTASAQMTMTKAEQDRVGRKMSEKSACLQVERRRRLKSAPPPPKRRPPSVATPSETRLSELMMYGLPKRGVEEKTAPVVDETPRTARAGAMFRTRSTMKRREAQKLREHLERCARHSCDASLVAHDSSQAKRLLLAATVEYSKCLQHDVVEFVDRSTG